MKFRSTTEEDMHIALTSGHTAVVGVEPTELDKKFHKEAIARGCLPEGVDIDEPVAAAGTAFNRVEVITKALNEMLDGGEEGDFTKAGKPDLAKLTARAGFAVSRVEADKIWEVVSKAD